MPNIRFFKTFVAIAQSGTFAAAAEKVGLTQAAVSLQMNALESDLQHPLFDRSGRVAKLNNFGNKVLPQAKRLIELYEELRMASAEVGEETGTIHIGAIVSMMGELSTIVAGLKRTHPRLKVNLSTAKSNELNTRMDQGELDFAITVQSSSNLKTRLKWTPLYREPLILIASRNIQSRNIEELLKKEPYLRFDRAQQTGLIINRAIQQLGIRPREFLELNSLEAIVELVRQDVGVSVIPLLRNATWKSDPALRILPMPRATVKRTIGMLERKEHDRAELISLIRQHIQKNAAAA